MVWEKFVLIDNSLRGQRAGELHSLADSKGFGEEWYPYQEMIRQRYESSHLWVLCNLSKGVYVPADPAATLTDSDGSTPFILGTDYTSINLGHILLSQICWSSDETTGLDYQGNLHRGPWAGDRFEVTSMDKLDPSIAWKDISDEAVGTVDKIWQSEYEYNWKEQLREGCPWWAIDWRAHCLDHVYNDIRDFDLREVITSTVRAGVNMTSIARHLTMPMATNSRPKAT